MPVSKIKQCKAPKGAFGPQRGRREEGGGKREEGGGREILNLRFKNTGVRTTLGRFGREGMGWRREEGGGREILNLLFKNTGV